MRMGKIILLVAILSAVGTSNSVAKCTCTVKSGTHLSLSVFNWRDDDFVVTTGVPNNHPVTLLYTRAYPWGRIIGDNGELGWADYNYLRSCGRAPTNCGRRVDRPEYFGDRDPPDK